VGKYFGKPNFELKIPALLNNEPILRNIKYIKNRSQRGKRAIWQYYNLGGQST
jgi:hypothetical protein